MQRSVRCSPQVNAAHAHMQGCGRRCRRAAAGRPRGGQAGALLGPASGADRCRAHQVGGCSLHWACTGLAGAGVDISDIRTTGVSRNSDRHGMMADQHSMRLCQPWRLRLPPPPLQSPQKHTHPAAAPNAQRVALGQCVLQTHPAAAAPAPGRARLRLDLPNTAECTPPPPAALQGPVGRRILRLP